jgi:antibiotic biosynthesis monooxygenase (ABM) superfamily enzyme
MKHVFKLFTEFNIFIKYLNIGLSIFTICYVSCSFSQNILHYIILHILHYMYQIYLKCRNKKKKSKTSLVFIKNIFLF